ncbi:MAG: DUF5684 domain-containing protein [Chitinophagales bacterium]
MSEYLGNLNGEGIGMLIALLAMFALAAALFIAMVGCLKVFEKAGREPWHAFVPYFNIFILTNVAGKPFWWTLFLLVPVLNVVVWFILCHGLSSKFKKPIFFSVGLALLFPVFICILGFSNAKYQSET